jgi:hypothetical protein
VPHTSPSIIHWTLLSTTITAVSSNLGCSLSRPEATASAAPAAPAAAQAVTLAERGHHLVLIAGCNDCHTPLKLGPNGPEPDMSRMLSGDPESPGLPPAPKPQGPWIVAANATNTAWAGPWGISHTSNLTPDRDTGLGTWSKEAFIATFRTGRRLGSGRALLPPMPIPSYQNFTVDELESIFAYLESIPKLSNRVPAPTPPTQ